MNLRTRIALLAGATTFVTVASVCGAAYAVYAAGQSSRIDGSLIAAAAQADTLARGLKEETAFTGRVPAVSKPLSVGDVELLLITDNIAAGQVTDLGPLTDTDVQLSDGRTGAYFASVEVSGQAVRVYTTRLTGSGGALVRAGEPASVAAGDRLRVVGALSAATLLSALLAAFVGRLVAARALRPVSQLTAAADAIRRTGDLSARLAGGETDEVRRLGQAFNGMLEALEVSVGAQRQLLADASHELRTPLTSMRINLELLAEPPGLRDPRAPHLLRRAREQVTELTDLVNDVVQLARTGAADLVLDDVRLDLLVAAVLSRSHYRQDVQLSTDLHPSVVRVDMNAVEKAVGNLVDNALKWSPPDGTVEVVVEEGTVTVTDQGPGIPEAELPHVFQRFYRAPTARSMPGSGLGLAIVAQVAETNGGVVAAESSPAGSTFRLSFPAAGAVKDGVEDAAGRDGTVGQVN